MISWLWILAIGLIMLTLTWITQVTANIQKWPKKSTKIAHFINEEIALIGVSWIFVVNHGWPIWSIIPTILVISAVFHFLQGFPKKEKK